MKLLVVIPALNEEQSIQSIIKRTEDAKNYIFSNSNVTSLDIVVVSDGSTDATVSLASKLLPSNRLIIFEKNRGYGAAIKAGWEVIPEAELLGFIDADGTCNPLFFADLCQEIVNKNADIALGSRLNKQSEMPMVRRLGNSLFSFMLSLVSNQHIKDTASGMRVIRRSALHQIMPLPDGLHFTPAMSARAILSKQIRIVEKDMPYAEREGESKLKIWRDGKRFLNVILENIFLYMPYRIISAFGLLFLFIALMVILQPLIFYLKNSYLEEWMLYRFIVSVFCGLAAMLFFSAASIMYTTISITLQPNNRSPSGLANFLFHSKGALWLSLSSFIVGTLLIINSFWDRITTGLTNEHWSRYLAMLFFYVFGLILALTYFSNSILNLVKDRLLYLQDNKI